MDLRYAIRGLGRERGFALAAVGTLALGIGATTTIFSFASAVLLRPFPFLESDRLVAIQENDAAPGNEHLNSSYPTFLEWRARSRTLVDVAASDDRSMTVRIGAQAERLEAAHASWNLFTMLGVRPVAGRGFTEDEDRPGGERVALIGYGLWRARYAGAGDAVGRTIAVGGEPYTIVGVLPEGFDYPSGAQLWIPFALSATQGRANHWIDVVGRLRDGVRLEEARAELGTISERLARTYPEANGGYTASLAPLRDALVRNVRPLVLVLIGAVALVLLIACANVANLLLARSTVRERELAIRGALGASGRRLARQRLTESLLLALLGGTAGTLLTVWWLHLLLASSPVPLPVWLHVHIDARVLAFTLVITTAIALGLGLAPAVRAARVDMQSALRDGARGATGGRRGVRLRDAFVIAEMALAIILLAGGLLTMRSFLALRDVDTGFRKQDLLTLQVDLSRASYPEDARVVSFYDRLLERVRALPGVTSAAAASWFPAGGANNRSYFDVQGIGQIGDAYVYTESVSPDYFTTMGIPMLGGRAFDARDGRATAPVAIVNRALAERFFPGEDPLGQGIRLGSGSTALYSTIVGVVDNVTQDGPAQASPGYDVYQPYSQQPWTGMTLVLRSNARTAATVAAIRDVVLSLDPNVPVHDVRTVERILENATVNDRLLAAALATFAAAALLLAAVGLYGVMAFSVARRTHEIGVRVALGATSRDVRRLVLGRALRLLLAGTAIGLAGALALSRALAGILFGVRPEDPATLVTVPLVLAAVSLIACWIPARRAARVDPIVSLRAE